MDAVQNPKLKTHSSELTHTPEYLAVNILKTNRFGNKVIDSRKGPCCVAMQNLWGSSLQAKEWYEQ